MIVCHCKAVTDRAIREAVRRGARTRNQVVGACAASLECGGCAPAVDAILNAELGSPRPAKFARRSAPPALPA